MRKLLIVGCTLTFLVTGCSPAATSVPTELPTVAPTPTVIVENPPPC
ncbi:MAG TPA: hypothetical protein VJ785_00390 [Anaerolineales bacterium]|nr:hypothetical protein [Anaerolineales bacterium]